MKTLLYILILSLSTTMIFGQVPGYLGKRLSIEGDFNIFPNFTNTMLNNSSRETLNKYNDTEYYYNSTTGNYEPQNVIKYNTNLEPIEKKRYMRWTFKPSFSINYTIARRVVASLRLSKIYGNLVYNSNYGASTVFFDDNLKYQTSDFELNFKFYKKNFIAPVGKYVLFGLGYSIMNMKETSGTILNIDYINYENIYSLEEATFNHRAKLIKFNFGFGNKTILKDYLYLTYGTEFNLYLITGNGIALNEERNLATFKDNFNNALTKNLLYDNMFNVKVGLGIIL